MNNHLSESGNAYVSLLHGDLEEFFVYALVLGVQLQQLDPDIPRILLVGREHKCQRAPSAESQQCLRKLWTLRKIDLIDAPEADSTPSKRHRFVFSKLKAMQVPVRKLLFLDLDILPRTSLRKLFHLRPPAGMHHGDWSFHCPRSHGTYWQAKAYKGGCANAGVMILRGDTPLTVTHLLEQVPEISKGEATALPEQYFMARKMRHWRQISVAWNYEVYRSISVDTEWSESTSQWQWSDVSWGHLPMAWWGMESKQDLKDKVKIFHFSGSSLQPWWYLRFVSEGYDIETAEKSIDDEFVGRDSRGLTGLAVSEWLRAVVKALAMFVPNQTLHDHISLAISLLAGRAQKYRLECPRCSRQVWEVYKQPFYESRKRKHRCDATSCCEECAVKFSHSWCVKHKITRQSYKEWVSVTPRR